MHLNFYLPKYLNGGGELLTTELIKCIAIENKEITLSLYCQDSKKIPYLPTNILNELHKQTQNTETKFELGFLVENKLSIEENLNKLDFMPSVYVPYYRLLTKKKIEELHQRGLKVFTWTVNDTETMQKLKNWGVDSIITDFPNRIPTLVTA